MLQNIPWFNNSSPDLKPLQRFLGELLILILIVAVAVTISLRLWEANLKIPFQYNIKESKFPWANFDVSYFLAYLKNCLEGGWVDSIPRLGAPGKLESYSFPFPFFPIAIFGSTKILSIFTGGSLALTVNCLYIFSFFSTAIAAFVVFRQYLIFEISVILSILFAFIPYHVETGMIFAEQGMTYGYTIPFSILIALWLAHGDFFDLEEVKNQNRTRWNRKKIAIAIGITLLTAMTNTYYPFFSALFWITAVLLATFNQPRRLKLSSLLIGLSLLVGLGLSLLILVSPVIVHRLQTTEMVIPLARSWQDSEFWGLKIIQLYLPIREHYISWMTAFAQKYGSYPYAHVNASVALGLIGSIGFTSLIVAFFIETLPILRSRLFKTLSRMNLVAVLFATVAGYGTFFALAVTPEIRALYRMAPYISFFSLFAVGLMLQSGLKQFFTLDIKLAKKKIILLALALLLVTGVADQTGHLAVPQYAAIAKTFLSHETFFRALESQLPNAAMVFQVPYEQFPEGGKENFENRWTANDSFIPFLHTKTLHWSHGSTRGSMLAGWKKMVAERPTAEMVQNLCQAGFAAILLDYEQFATRAQAQIMLDQLSLSSPLIVKDQEGRYAAFQTCKTNH